MGRTIEFHIVRRDVDHDKGKPLCFGWEFQDDESVMDRKINREEYLFESPDWCPRCRMFYYGFYDGECTIDSLGISHSYSNPVWSSDYCIYNMGPGDDSAFTKLFRSDMMIREITRVDIICIKKELEVLGEPFRTSDKEAKEETLRVMDFIEHWLSRKDIYIIYQREI